MKVLLLGATGRTGQWVLEIALERGYEVHCLVRDSRKIENQNNLVVFEGNPSNINDLDQALEGCRGIISTLNISRASDFPWSGLRTSETFLSDVMCQLIPLAKKYEIRRLITCSAWGVAETRNDIPGWFRWFIDHSNIGAAYRDHERQEELIVKSELDWTIVRPVGLTNSQKEETIVQTVNNTPRPNLTISRKSVGRFLVDCLESKKSIHDKIVISRK